MTTPTSKPQHRGRLIALILAAAALAGCEEGAELPGFLQPGDKPEAAAADTATSTRLIERDIEAPEVFQVTEAGLWDGRPSLGGVWVAHPDAKDPERVIIRNSANGKFVIGALFRRERAIPGPRIQASSDAAAALGMLAGAPVELNVTALRRETVEPEPAPDAQATAAAPDAAPEISETALAPATGAATVATAASVASKPVETPGAAAPAAAPAQPKPKPKSSLDKPYIQIGIFSVEANANRTADQMRSAGMIPVVHEQSSSGKKFWRVLVGPAQTKSDRAALLKKVQAAGFTDAYFVTN